MTETARKPSPRRISLPHIVLLVPWVVVVGGSFKTVRDNSYLWHIRAGQMQAGSGRVITEDPFSYTMAGEPWLTQSWLAELLYAAGHLRFGVGSASLIVLLASSVTLIGIGVLAHRVSRSIAATAVTVILTAILIGPFLVPRPVILSFALMVLVLLAWESKTLRWSLPFLMWIWASVHGSFAIGLAYLGLRWIADREWKAWPQLFASGLATLVTAHGLWVVGMLTDFAIVRPQLSLISEWRTPDFITPVLGPFLIGLFIIIYGSMKGRLPTSALWVIVPFVILGMSASRAVFPAWIGLAPVVAMSLSGVEWRWGRGFPRSVALVVGTAIVMFPLILIAPVAIDDERFPVDAAPHLNDVRTYHDDLTGGYLIFVDRFSEGVFIDDRVELYGERIEEFVKVRAGRRAWEPVFERDRIEQALLKIDEPMIAWLAGSGWKEIYRDDFYVILRRS